MGVRLLAIALILLILVSIPVNAGRTGNGTSDYMQASMQSGQQLFPVNLSTQAQGTVSFRLNLIAFPPTGGGPGPGCGVHCGEIVNIPGGHQAGTQGCFSTTGACLDIFVCPSGTCSAGFANTIIMDMTGNFETEVGWTITTGSQHVLTFLLNRTAANNKMYRDGVLVTASASSSTGDPGAINYSGSGTCGSNPCKFTVLAATSGTGAPDNFVAATISDLAFWNVTLTPGEITSLANCVPPDRIEPEHVSYWPLYGVDATEPNYTGILTGTPTPSVNPFNLTVNGTTRSIQQVGCQPGGAYH